MAALGGEDAPTSAEAAGGAELGPSRRVGGVGGAKEPWRGKAHDLPYVDERPCGKYTVQERMLCFRDGKCNSVAQCGEYIIPDDVTPHLQHMNEGKPASVGT